MDVDLLCLSKISTIKRKKYEPDHKSKNIFIISKNIFSRWKSLKLFPAPTFSLYELQFPPEDL